MTLDVVPPRLARRGDARARGMVLAGVARDGVGDAAARAHLAHRGAVPEAELHAMGLAAVGKAVAGMRVDPDRWAQWTAAVRSEVDSWCAAHPLEFGRRPRRYDGG